MQPSPPLRQLVEQIDRAGLSVPVAIILQIVAPLDVLCSHGAHLIAPLARGTALGPVCELMATPAHWPLLRDLLTLHLRER